MVGITRLIVIMLILLSTPCFSEERDKIRSYSDDKGNTIYTNEHQSSQSKVPNPPSGNVINPFTNVDNRNTAQRQDAFKPPVSPQPLPNYNAVENNILKSFARIVTFQILIVIICSYVQFSGWSL